MKREVSSEEGLELANKLGAVSYMEVSARTGFNVQHLFALILREIVSRELKEDEKAKGRRTKKAIGCLLL